MVALCRCDWRGGNGVDGATRLELVGRVSCGKHYAVLIGGNGWGIGWCVALSRSDWRGGRGVGGVIRVGLVTRASCGNATPLRFMGRAWYYTIRIYEEIVGVGSVVPLGMHNVVKRNIAYGVS